MTPLEFHKSVQELLQWDTDRLAALFTGLFFGAACVWWFFRRKSTDRSSGQDDVKSTAQELGELRARIRGLNEDKQRLEREKQSLMDEITRLKRGAESIDLDRIEVQPDETVSSLTDSPESEMTGIAKKKRAYLVGEGSDPRRVDRLVKVHDFKGRAIYVYFLVSEKLKKADSRNLGQQIAMYRQSGHEVAHPEKPFDDVPFWIRHGKTEAARLGLVIG